MGKKIKQYVFMTPKGEKTMYFMPLTDVGPEEVVCKTRCKHGKYCRVLPDPTDPENPKRKFSDFCGELGEDGKQAEDFLNMIPCDGCVEEVLMDVCGEDIVSRFIKNNTVVPVKDVINTVCSSFCDEYSTDFCNCSSNNCSCILNSLLKNRDLTQPDFIGADGIPDAPEDEIDEESSDEMTATTESSNG